jgi:putative lipoic acid-binding regulatory protein
VSTDAFYKKLKATLEETTKFPVTYLYKFIVPSDGGGVEEIEQLFDNLGAVIDTKKSSKGKYTAVSIEVKVPSADFIIKKYKEVAKVKGVISL